MTALGPAALVLIGFVVAIGALAAANAIEQFVRSAAQGGRAALR